MMPLKAKTREGVFATKKLIKNMQIVIVDLFIKERIGNHDIGRDIIT